MFSRQGELVLLFISPLIGIHFGLRDHTRPAFVCVYYRIQWAFISHVS